MNKIEHIVVSIGNIQSDQAVLDRAFYLAKVHQARLTIVHMAEEEVVSSGYAYLDIDVKDSCTRQDIEEAIEKMHSTVPTEVVMLKSGQLVHKLLEQAQTCQLMVIGHRYRSFMADLFLPHTDSKIIKRAPCDIYIVHLEA